MLDQLIKGLGQLRSVMSAGDNPFKAPIVKLIINSLPLKFVLNTILEKAPVRDEYKEQLLGNLVSSLNASGQTLGEFIFTDENISAIENLLKLAQSFKSESKSDDAAYLPFNELEKIGDSNEEISQVR